MTSAGSGCYANASRPVRQIAVKRFGLVVLGGMLRDRRLSAATGTVANLRTVDRSTQIAWSVGIGATSKAGKEVATRSKRHPRRAYTHR